MKSEKFTTRKVLPKISIQVQSKLNEPKTIDLIKQKGFEFTSSTSDTFDLFEAISFRVFGKKSNSLKIANLVNQLLTKWKKTNSYPKELEFISQIKDFIEFYQAFPNHIFFEAVFLIVKFKHFGTHFKNQNYSIFSSERK